MIGFIAKMVKYTVAMLELCIKYIYIYTNYNKHISERIFYGDEGLKINDNSVPVLKIRMICFEGS